jgi:hypothetical protein
MMDAGFEQAAFRQWLEARRSQVVGVAGDGYVCPLAKWLEEARGGRCFINASGWVDEAGWWDLIPGWAAMFVRELDEEYPWPAQVTGEQALALLAVVRKVYP